MTNADKYLKDGVENIESLIKDFFHFVGCVEDSNRYNNIYQFFLNEAKPTLTEDEKVILKNVSIDFRYIRREQNGALYFCVAQNKGCVSNIFANGLFDCIQPRRRI